MNKKLISLVVSMLLFATTFMVTVNGTFEQPENNDVPLTEDDWSMFQQNAGHTGFSLSTAPEDNEIAWIEPTSIPTTGQAVIVDSKVYIAAGDLICRNAYNGNVEWENDDVYTFDTPSVVQNYIYGTTYYDELYCIDITGSTIWIEDLPHSSLLVLTQVVADGKVFVGGVDYTNISCFNATDGSFIWEQYTTPGYSSARPAYYDGKVFIAISQKVFCFDADSGSPVWQQTVLPSPDAFSGGAVTVVDGRVYTASVRGVVSCLDASDGSITWQYSASGVISSSVSPAVAYGNLYIGLGTNVICLDAATGGVMWIQPTIAPITQSSPAVADNKIYVADFNWDPVNSGEEDTLYCLDAMSGDVIWTYSQPTHIHGMRSPSIAEGYLFMNMGLDAEVPGGHGVYFYAFFDNRISAPSIQAPRWNNKNDAIPFTVNVTHPRGFDVDYYFKWDGHSIAGPYGPYPSGEEVTIEYTYPRDITPSTTYLVSVQARDDGGNESDWSEPISVTVNNTAPGKPLLSGPSTGEVGEEIEFEFTLYDNENDTMDVKFFGYALGGFSGSYEPGTYTRKLIFAQPGTYEISIRSREVYGSQMGHGYTSPPSDNVTITLTPVIEIGAIRGGLLKISAEIKNNGDVVANDIQWNISIAAAFDKIAIILVGGETSGTIDTIEVGASQNAIGKPIIGIGEVDITVTARRGVEEVTKTAHGFLFLIFVVVTDSG